MNVGDRIVVRNVYINMRRGYGDWHGTIRGINVDTAEVQDDFGNYRWYPLTRLEKE